MHVSCLQLKPCIKCDGLHNYFGFPTWDPLSTIFETDASFVINSSLGFTNLIVVTRMLHLSSIVPWDLQI